MISQFQFHNQLFLITGGSEGIGLAISQIAVKNGASAILIARDAQKLESARLSLEGVRTNPNQKILCQSLDVTRDTDVESSIKVLIEKHGCPNLVINNAGFARPGYIQDLTAQDFRNMMDVNYFGTVNVCRAVVPAMISRGSGHIVNVSSMAGFLGLFGYTGYCASKYAVLGFSEALKNELKPFKINVSVLCPPNTRTPGLDKENQFKPAEVLATEEKVKVVDPTQVAEALFSALARKKFMIVPTFDGSLAYYLKRMSPWVIEQFTKRPSAN